MPLCLHMSPHEAPASVMGGTHSEMGRLRPPKGQGVSKSTHSAGGIIRHQNAGVLTLKSFLCLTQPPPRLLPPCFPLSHLAPPLHVKLGVCHSCSHAGKRARPRRLALSVAGSQARLTGLWLPVCLSRTSGDPPAARAPTSLWSGWGGCRGKTGALGEWGGGEGAGAHVPFIQQNLSNPFTGYSAASHAASSC